MTGYITRPDALYDVFVRAWTLGIVAEGLQDDTMLKPAELYPELDKQELIFNLPPRKEVSHMAKKMSGKVCGAKASMAKPAKIKAGKGGSAKKR